MASIDEFFGDYIKKEDIQKETVVSIKEVKAETIGRGDDAEEKLVVYFNELEKGLALNKINAEAIAEIANNRETGTWKGLKITLYVDKNVQFAGNRVGGVRVKVPSQGVSN